VLRSLFDIKCSGSIGTARSGCSAETALKRDDKDAEAEVGFSGYAKSSTAGLYRE
jgi:hypothetical protein